MEGLNREYALRASTGADAAPRPFPAARPGLTRPPPRSLGAVAANLLLHLARPEPGDVVIDCMTGTGTVTGEAAAAFPVFSLGSDMNEPAIQRANAVRGAPSPPRVAPRAAARTPQCRPLQVFGGPSDGARSYTPRQVSDFALADATRLPYRRASVDCCVVELPFGKRCGRLAALPAVRRARRGRPPLPPRLLPPHPVPWTRPLYAALHQVRQGHGPSCAPWGASWCAAEAPDSARWPVPDPRPTSFRPQWWWQPTRSAWPRRCATAGRARPGPCAPCPPWCWAGSTSWPLYSVGAVPRRGRRRPHSLASPHLPTPAPLLRGSVSWACPSAGKEGGE